MQVHCAACLASPDKVCWFHGESLTKINLPGAEKDAVNGTLKHLGLEPWPDGRSVYDGKRPWEQHIGMVLGALKAENAVFRAALQEIKDRWGMVCPDFETCTHQACRASHAAWEISNKALS